MLCRPSFVEHSWLTKFCPCYLSVVAISIYIQLLPFVFLPLKLTISNSDIFSTEYPHSIFDIAIFIRLESMATTEQDRRTWNLDPPALHIVLARMIITSQGLGVALAVGQAIRGSATLPYSFTIPIFAIWIAVSYLSGMVRRCNGRPVISAFALVVLCGLFHTAMTFLEQKIHTRRYIGLEEECHQQIRDDGSSSLSAFVSVFKGVCLDAQQAAKRVGENTLDTFMEGTFELASQMRKQRWDSVKQQTERAYERATGSSYSSR